MEREKFMSLSGLQKLGFALSPLYTVVKGAQTMGKKMKEKWDEKSGGEKVLSFMMPSVAYTVDRAKIIKEDFQEKTPAQKIASIFSPVLAIATSVSNYQE